jgi:hypothetical protein
MPEVKIDKTERVDDKDASKKKPVAGKDADKRKSAKGSKAPAYTGPECSLRIFSSVSRTQRKICL